MGLEGVRLSLAPIAFPSSMPDARLALSRVPSLPLSLPKTGVTQFLVDNDLYRLWNWFDDRTW